VALQAAGVSFSISRKFIVSLFWIKNNGVLDGLVNLAFQAGNFSLSGVRMVSNPPIFAPGRRFLSAGGILDSCFLCLSGFCTRGSGRNSAPIERVGHILAGSQAAMACSGSISGQIFSLVRKSAGEERCRAGGRHHLTGDLICRFWRLSIWRRGASPITSAHALG
jgi:hypothetical protein